MSWDGAGNFNRLFSWVADKAAGLDISSSRMDSDTDNITSIGFGNCLTRDGQGQPTADLPMAGFRHTGVQNAVNRSDYAALGQVQDDLLNWTIAGGTSDAITAAYTPSLTVLNDGQICYLRATAANATTTPTFAPNGLTARVITKLGGSALGLGDIAGALVEIILRYNVANTRWELLNPSNAATNTLVNSISTGVVWLTVAASAPSGWLMFDDGTFGSATSGSSNSNSAANQALFTVMFGGISDTFAPLLTSTGSATTRAAQGSAAAAWAANCRMSLPKTLGRALGVAGSGSGLTARTLGTAIGVETTAIAQNQLPNVALGLTASGTVLATVGNVLQGTIQALNNGTGTGGVFQGIQNGTAVSNQLSSTGTFGGATASMNGGVTQVALSLIQPSSFMNAIVKQ